jgi:hypothetical protein
MSAFLDLLDAYAIWIYIVGVVGILFGIKMLVDSRRLARTTMFTLEQEQAGEQAFRAIIVMVAFGLLIGGVSAVNTLIGPVRPTPIPLIVKQTTVAFTPVLILPTLTAVPTLTPEPPTATPTEPPTPEAKPTVQPTSPPRTQAPAPAPTAAPVPAATSYPPPKLIAPINKSTYTRPNFLQLRWDSQEEPIHLPQGVQYKITVYYTDRLSNQRKEVQNCSSTSTIDTNYWPDLGNIQGQSVDWYYWYVVVVQLPNVPNATCFNGTPISPQSEVFSFKWP